MSIERLASATRWLTAERDHLRRKTANRRERLNALYADELLEALAQQYGDPPDAAVCWLIDYAKPLDFIKREWARCILNTITDYPERQRETVECEPWFEVAS